MAEIDKIDRQLGPLAARKAALEWGLEAEQQRNFTKRQEDREAYTSCAGCLAYGGVVGTAMLGANILFRHFFGHDENFTVAAVSAVTSAAGVGRVFGYARLWEWVKHAPGVFWREKMPFED